MTALQHLDINNTTFEGFDARGLSMCQGLRVLKVQKSRAHSVLHAADHSCTPFGMSLLTQLETLSLTSSLRTAEPISLAWISELTTLQDLRISLTYVWMQAQRLSQRILSDPALS
ncbi:TPA: hypothetical protein ACH3X1_014098 [Trebouxia sp. C0004]